MISEALVFLKNHLNAQLNAHEASGESSEDKVVFVDGEKMDPITFKLGAVSVLLLNIEEERRLRAPDLYTRVTEDGTPQRVQPEIRMNLYVLFVARFKQYELGLSYLSRIIQHFQSNRVLARHNAPSLPDSIDKLIMELITLEFSEQNEVWNALRTTYHPSVLYRAKMVVFTDQDGTVPREITEADYRAAQ